MTPLPIKPFGQPVPGQDTSTVILNTRGNDNVLREGVNQVADNQMTGVASSQVSTAHAANLYDPRFAPEDGDHLLGVQAFCRFYGRGAI